MENTLRVIETENIVVYNDFCYGPKIIKECKDFIGHMKDTGNVRSDFDDEKWICYSGVKNYEISFSFDKTAYMNAVGKAFMIPYKTMQEMIKCYACYCTGEFIFDTIAREIVNNIKRFLCNSPKETLSLTRAEKEKIEDFLALINTPVELIDDMTSNIKIIKSESTRVRKLSPLINYLVIENEINEMYFTGVTDEEFTKYFPIYFWVNITFILPLRATEMLVTPFDCIDLTDDMVTLRVRRSKLKGGKNRVYYDVEKDYDLCTYNLGNIINRQVFNNIEKYKNLTKNHKRRFLFDYGEAFTNHMISLAGFNNLLRVFIDERIIDNPKYEYSKKVSGVDEFEYVTAGDSRPIAMANLYFQDAGADICRQLANHMNVSTSEGYFTNVSETLYYSSIMQMQKKINRDFLNENYVNNSLVVKDRYNCSSPRRLKDENSIEDCKGHYQSCFGCKYYHPDDAEIHEHMRKREQEYRNSVKKMQSVLKSVGKLKGRDVDMDELFLKIHTASTRYKESTDVYAEKEAKKWLEQQSSQMISC